MLRHPLILMSLAGVAVVAADEPVQFNRDVRPILMKHQNSVFDLKRGNVWSKLDSLKREPG